MRDFNRSRGSSSFRREMHPAVCSNCGKNCEVPFRPSGEKPIFCNQCFRKDSGDSRPRGERQGPNYQSQFDALNQKLDTILSLISQPKKPKVKKEL